MTGKPNVTEELEALIDATSLLDVLTGLELVCSEKAEHVRSNWQDKALAKLWDRASIHTIRRTLIASRRRSANPAKTALPFAPGRLERSGV